MASINGQRVDFMIEVDGRIRVVAGSFGHRENATRMAGLALSLYSVD
jgi:hypothetical protein